MTGMFHAGATVLVEIFQLVQLAAAAAHTTQVPTRLCARQQAVRVDTNIPPRNRHVSVSMTFITVYVIRTIHTVNQLLSVSSIHISTHARTHAHTHARTHARTQTPKHTHTQIDTQTESSMFARSNKNRKKG